MSAEGPPEPVLVVVQPFRGTLKVTGSEAKSWLNGLVSCDVLKVSEGSGAFGLALNKQGKIQSEAVVVASADGLLVGVSPGLAERLCGTLDKFLVMEDAELSLASDHYVWADFFGVAAGALASAAAASCGGTAAAVNFAGQPAATLVLERDSLLEFERFVERTPTMRLASDADWDARRIELGLGRFGVDFGEADNPHEAALDRRAVSWTKGCYLGQEVVCMQDMRGKLKRRLVALALPPGAAEPAPGTPVTDGAPGEVVGELTSVALSPHTGSWLGLARLKSPHFEGKSALFVAGQPALFVKEPTAELS